MISGTVKLENGYPLNCVVSVRDTQGKQRRSVKALNGIFSIDWLDPEKEYMVSVDLDAVTKTNIVEQVKPNGPPLELVVANGYRVTGTVVDKDGKPLRYDLKCKTSNSEWIYFGEFVLFPLFSGKHILEITAEGYVPMEKEISVGYADTDVGEIVILDRGCSLSGTLIDTDDNLLAEVYVRIYNPKDNTSRYVKTDFAGKFSFKHLPYDTQLELNVRKQRQDIFINKIPALSGDEDLGKIQVDFSPNSPPDN